MLPALPSRVLSLLGGASLIAALAACADAGPEPVTPTPEGPTGKAAVPYPIAPEPTVAATATATAATAAPVGDPAPAATAEAEPPAEVVIDMRLSDAKKEGGKLVYDADSTRMTATHRVYELDAAELEKALAKKKKGAERVSLRLACGPASTSVSAGDPRGARPMGGFTYHTRTCTISEVLSAD